LYLLSVLLYFYIVTATREIYTLSLHDALPIYVLDRKVRKADTAVGDFTKNVGNYKSAFSGLSNLMGAFGVVGGITGVVMLGKSIYQTTKEIQAQEIALKMLSETEETYAKNKDFLIRISEQ